MPVGAAASHATAPRRSQGVWGHGATRDMKGPHACRQSGICMWHPPTSPTVRRSLACSSECLAPFAKSVASEKPLRSRLSMGGLQVVRLYACRTQGSEQPGIGASHEIQPANSMVQLMNSMVHSTNWNRFDSRGSSPCIVQLVTHVRVASED
eukprot:3684048-Prymnesium_polylepis.1